MRAASVNTASGATRPVEIRGRRETATLHEDRFIFVSTRSQARRPAMKLRARAAAAEAILDAAEQVAVERGLEATSIAAIAEAAGVAVGTLYNYFPDRDHLLESLFEHRRAALLPRLEAAVAAARGLPLEPALRTYLRGVIAAFEDHRRFLRVVIASTQGDGRVPSRKNVLMPKILEALEALLRPEVGPAAGPYAHMILGAFKGLLHWRVEQGEPIAPDADLIVGTFVRGIAR